MIGRTLDAVLDTIALRGLRREGSDSLIHGVASKLRDKILPVERLHYRQHREDGELKDILVECPRCVMNWSNYNGTDGRVKRLVAKAFEMRRKVDVGEKFTLKDPRKSSQFYHSQDYSVKRLSKNAVIVHHRYPYSYLVSSSKEELLEHRDKGLIPVHYKWVVY